MQRFLARVLQLILRSINNQNLSSNFQAFQEPLTKCNLRFDKFLSMFIAGKCRLTSGLPSGLLRSE